MFPEEYNTLKCNKILHSKNRLISISPFIDSCNILRVGGRLQNSNYTYDIKHPILLCSKHHLTKIMFKSYHLSLFHAGPQLLLANIRVTYWPLGGRNLAKQIVRTCIRCTRVKGKPIQVIMGNLPSERTQLDFPFLTTGLDFSAPVLIADRKGRGCKLLKSYICVFVCFAVRAVHLELVSDLTKESFLAVFSRFVARRGKPQRVYSDNSTTFVGALNQLKRLLQLSYNDLESDIANQGIEIYTTLFTSFWGHLGGSSKINQTSFTSYSSSYSSNL
ncbi:unnamed protein product [Parnassius mnemosyne]|uniref:Integrase zinc-binding domain-containing protein n=1 Tax=Parnassius mnemosyne TaxID=213953 RepID=A0AAV1LTE3_9NEOP